MVAQSAQKVASIAHTDLVPFNRPSALEAKTAVCEINKNPRWYVVGPQHCQSPLSESSIYPTMHV